MALKEAAACMGREAMDSVFALHQVHKRHFKQARHPVGRSRAIFTAFDVSNSVYKVNAAKEWLTSPTQVDSLMSSAGIAKKNPDSDIPGAFSGS